MRSVSVGFDFDRFRGVEATPASVATPNIADVKNRLRLLRSLFMFALYVAQKVSSTERHICCFCIETLGVEG